MGVKIDVRNVPSQAEMDKIMEQDEKNMPTQAEAEDIIKGMRKSTYRMVSMMYAVNILCIVTCVYMLLNGYPQPFVMVGLVGFMALHFMMTIIRLMRMSDNIGDKAVLSASKAMTDFNTTIKKKMKEMEKKNK